MDELAQFPLFVRLAIERLKYDEGLRTPATLDELLNAYAGAYALDPTPFREKAHAWCLAHLGWHQAKPSEPRPGLELRLGDRYEVMFRQPGGLVQWLPGRFVSVETTTGQQPTYLFEGSSWAAPVLHSELAQRVRPLTVDRYVIHAPSEADADDSGFWRNPDGWGDLRSATRFSAAETSLLNLPISSKDDARWVTESEAKTMVMYEEVMIDGLVAVRGNGTACVIYNNLIGANDIKDYDDYLVAMERELGITSLRGRQIGYRLRGKLQGVTTIPSTRPDEHRVRLATGACRAPTTR